MASLLRYAQAFHTQISLAAGCNATHSIVNRLARWLLMAHDRVCSNEFPLTHEIMSQILAVRRTGVTVTAGALRSSGLIGYSRGKIIVLDRAGLEGAACECYGTIQRITRRLNTPLP